MSWTRILARAMLMAFVLSLAVGAAESAVPNAQNKKFYACMNKRTRIIKMLNYPKVKSCPRRHKRISWNAKGNPRAPGAPGPAGPAGPTGAAGGPGVTRIALKTVNNSHTATTDPGAVFAYCPAGSKVTGGGFTMSIDADVRIVSSGPESDTGWFVTYRLDSGNPAVGAYVICMSTDPASLVASVSPSAKQSIKTAINKAKKKRR